MLGRVFKRLFKGPITRNLRRATNYTLTAAGADLLSDTFINELLQQDIDDCNRKSPSVIKRDTIFVPILNREVEGWHCYKSSNGRVYVYMLTTRERVIMF